MPDFTPGRYDLSVAGVDPGIAHVAPLTFFHWPWNTTAWALLLAGLLALAWAQARADAGYLRGILGAQAPAWLALGGLYGLTRWEPGEYLAAVLGVAALAVLVASLIVVGWRGLHARSFPLACAWPPALIALVTGIFISLKTDSWSLGLGASASMLAAALLAIPFVAAGVTLIYARRAWAAWLAFGLAVMAAAMFGAVGALAGSEEFRYLLLTCVGVGMAVAIPILVVRLALRSGHGWLRPLGLLTLMWVYGFGAALVFVEDWRLCGLWVLLMAALANVLYRLWRMPRLLRTGLLTLAVGLGGIVLLRAAVMHDEIDPEIAALGLPMLVWLMPLCSMRRGVRRAVTLGLLGGGALIAGLALAHFFLLPSDQREEMLSVSWALGAIVTLYLCTFLALVHWNGWAAAIAEGRPLEPRPVRKEDAVQVGIMLAAH